MSYYLGQRCMCITLGSYPFYDSNISDGFIIASNGNDSFMSPSNIIDVYMVASNICDSFMIAKILEIDL